MNTLQEFSIALILVLQRLSPALDGVMNFFTFLGKIEFYLIIIPFIYWAIDKRLGARMLFILIATDIISSTFKLLFHQPRPYWLVKDLKLAEETSYGIPSSHASDSLAVWGYMAYRLRKTWLTALIVIFLFFIGLSRLYLGVHFLHDVLFGWLIGGLVLWAFVRYEDGVAAWAGRQSMAAQIGTGFVLSLAVIVLGQLIQAWLSGIADPPAWSSSAIDARTPSYSFTLAGALFGALCGYVLMKRYAPFQNAGSGLQKLGRYVLGIASVLIVYIGLDKLFGMIVPDETVMGYALRYIRYGTVTFLMAFIAPWVFLKLGLAKPEPALPAEEISKATAAGQNI